MSDYLPRASDGLQLIPEQASAQAAQVDNLFFVLLALSGLLVLILGGLITYFGIRYRQGSKASRADRFSKKASNRLEIFWSLVLLVVFMFLFGWAGSLYLDIYSEPEADITINVVGKQWMWKSQHPDGRREINTLHVPADKTIRLRITSQDVIHSFYMPAFRLKRDALPGTYTYAWFKATKTGEYPLYCAEYCGLNHSRMRGKVVVMKQDAYSNWRKQETVGMSMVAAGKKLFHEKGCVSCHMADTDVAPDLAGIIGRKVKFSDGSTIKADEAYLRNSILRPQDDVVAGYQPIMPSFKGQLSETQIMQIIEYIKSLKPGDTEQPAENQSGDKSQ